MYKIYYVNALDTRSSSCSATKKTTRIFKLPSHDSSDTKVLVHTQR